MAPLIVLVVVLVIQLAIGAAGVRRLRPWPVALRNAVAAMFLFTGVSHFVGMREDLVSMVPPALPQPGLLVTITGLLELAGAVGLLLQRTRPWAAGGLAALLVAMFPANVYAALEDLTISGAPAMALVPRALLQLLFLAATLAVLSSDLRDRRQPHPSHSETLSAGQR